MGGYGALHLAFRHPQLFSSVSAHSAALIEKLPAFVNAPQSPRARVFGGTFGSPPDPVFWEQNSPIHRAAEIPRFLLKIYFDCGDQDDYGFKPGTPPPAKFLTPPTIPHKFPFSPS